MEKILFSIIWCTEKVGGMAYITSKIVCKDLGILERRGDHEGKTEHDVEIVWYVM